jgi:hypothetical protein
VVGGAPRAARDGNEVPGRGVRDGPLAGSLHTAADETKNPLGPDWDMAPGADLALRGWFPLQRNGRCLSTSCLECV